MAPLTNIRIAALLGMVVAGYAIYIEYSHQYSKNHPEVMAPTYFCDHLVSWASCSAAITGPYGKVLSKWGIVAKDGMFDIPNAIIGFSFYVLALVPWHKLTIAGINGLDIFITASTCSLLFSLYLAYVLKFIIHEFCIICVSSYTINIFIFIMAVRLWSAEQKKKNNSSSSSSSSGTGKKETTKTK